MISNLLRVNTTLQQHVDHSSSACQGFVRVCSCGHHDTKCKPQPRRTQVFAVRGEGAGGSQHAYESFMVRAGRMTAAGGRPSREHAHRSLQRRPKACEAQSGQLAASTQVLLEAAHRRQDVRAGDTQPAAQDSSQHSSMEEWQSKLWPDTTLEVNAWYTARKDTQGK